MYPRCPPYVSISKSKNNGNQIFLYKLDSCAALALSKTVICIKVGLYKPKMGTADTNMSTTWTFGG